MGLFWDSALEKASRQQIRQQAAGTGVSAARAQLAQGLQNTQRAMMAQAAGVRQNPLAAMRNAQAQGADMATQQNMQSAQLRAQEMQAAQAQQMQLAAQDNANQTALIGAVAGAASGGLGSLVSGLGTGGSFNPLTGAGPAAGTPSAYHGEDGSGQAQALSNVQGWDPQRLARARGGYTGNRTQYSGPTSGYNYTPFSFGPTSDIRQKDDVRDGAAATDEMLRQVHPVQFTYKHPDAPGQGPGTRTGVIAQDLQRADPNLVRRQPDGTLGLDPNAALSASLAANARLAQRLDALERRVNPVVPSAWRPTGGRGSTGPTIPVPVQNLGMVPHPGPRFVVTMGRAEGVPPEELPAVYDPVNDEPPRGTDLYNRARAAHPDTFDRVPEEETARQGEAPRSYSPNDAMIEGGNRVQDEFSQPVEEDTRPVPAEIQTARDLQLRDERERMLAAFYGGGVRGIARGREAPTDSRFMTEPQTTFVRSGWEALPRGRTAPSDPRFMSRPEVTPPARRRREGAR